jgi:hypothetical protein
MVQQSHPDYLSRAHFFGVSARIMRQILVDHARRRQSKKRDIDEGNAFPGTLQLPSERPIDIMALDQALVRLSSIDNRKSSLVEMRFFAGMTAEEIAECSSRLLHSTRALRPAPREEDCVGPLSRTDEADEGTARASASPEQACGTAKAAAAGRVDCRQKPTEETMKMQNVRQEITLFACLATGLLCAAIAGALQPQNSSVPTLVNFSGTLTDASGKLLPGASLLRKILKLAQNRDFPY